VSDPFPGGDEALDAALRDLARERRRSLGDDPSADELADYLAGALPPEEEERIQEHLALCPECASLVVDLAALLQPPAEAPPAAALPAGEREQAWERLAWRLRTAGGSATAPSRRWRGRPLALAASLILGIGLGVLGGRLIRPADRPRADVALLELAPEGAGAQRSTETARRFRLPARAGRVALLLDLGDLRRFPRYEVDLVAPDGRVAWRERDALRAEDGTFLLELPATAVATSGRYRIRLRGAGETASTPGTPLADYAVDVLPRR
jgi:hypothetical protein